jgi:chromosome segregation ATPase
VSRSPREREAEHAAIQAAARRLLAGTPLRSVSGKLTVSELITESALRRDVVYADYSELVEEFRARVKAQDSTPLAMQALAGENARLKEKITEIKAGLAEERAAAAALRKAVAELSLELRQAREELVSAGNVTRLPVRGSGPASQR